MNSFAAAALTAGAFSFSCTLLLVWLAGHQPRVYGDTDVSGPHKFHSSPVPRIGGVGVLLGVLVGLVVLRAAGVPEVNIAFVLLACASPAFVSGFVEDLTKRVSAAVRLIATILAALLACVFVQAVIPRADLVGFDQLLSILPIAVAVTVLAVGGMAHAVNLIDGLNGLASMSSMLMFGAIAFVAHQAGDQLVAAVALIGLAAIGGFFVLNYPAGLIFLGDGGAYLTGFLLAETCVLLMARNPEVSPMFCLLVCGYPIFETLFSVYRRKVLRRAPSMAPDGIHLHSLVYRRLIRWAAGDRTPRAMNRRNSMASPFLWALTLLTVLPACLFWNDTDVLLLFIALFIVVYLAMYWSIARFKAFRWF
jgi:UDP-N-acetylmuramyl pentapeptide phosphotransferase/UDP-N-acetylglucosamine-1-phosphate transferase